MSDTGRDRAEDEELSELVVLDFLLAGASATYSIGVDIVLVNSKNRAAAVKYICCDIKDFAL